MAGIPFHQVPKFGVPSTQRTSIFGGSSTRLSFGTVHPYVVNVKDALQLSMTISQLLRRVHAEDVREYGRGNELLRASLLRLQSSPSVVNDKEIQIWVNSCLDILRPLAGKLQSWQEMGCLSEYLLDENHRKSVEFHFLVLSSHTQIVRTHFRTRSVGNLATADALPLSQVSHMILDDQGRDFWVNSFGNTTYEVDWNSVLRVELSNRVGDIQVFLEDPKLTSQLEELLKVSETGKVTAYSWGGFLDAYGPGIQRAVKNVRGTLGEVWFAGFISFDESCALLRTCSPGAFLVRFSRTQPCGFAVAFVDMTTGEVTQTLVKAQSPRHPERSSGFEMDGSLYPSLKVLVESNSATLRFPAPTLETHADDSFFKGSISFDEANALLQGAPIGTFLMRFSQQHLAALVIAFVSADNSVQQSIVYCEPENGGYWLGDGCYSTLDKMIMENSDQLKYPLLKHDFPPPDILKSSTSLTPTVDHVSATPLQNESVNYEEVPGAAEGMDAFAENLDYGAIPGADNLASNVVTQEQDEYSAVPNPQLSGSIPDPWKAPEAILREGKQQVKIENEMSQDTNDYVSLVDALNISTPRE